MPSTELLTPGQPWPGVALPLVSSSGGVAGPKYRLLPWKPTLRVWKSMGSGARWGLATATAGGQCGVEWPNICKHTCLTWFSQQGFPPRLSFYAPSPIHLLDSVEAPGISIDWSRPTHVNCDVFCCWTTLLKRCLSIYHLPLSEGTPPVHSFWCVSLTSHNSTPGDPEGVT